MEQTLNPPAEESIFSEEEFSMEGYDKHIRNARILLFVIGGLSLLALMYVLPLDGSFQKLFMLIWTLAFAGAFVALGFWTKKKPYTALLVALILFLAIQVLSVIGDPASIMQGWIFKIIIVVMLINGLRNARESQRMMEAFGRNKRN
jgi:hypothetical protein